MRRQKRKATVTGERKEMHEDLDHGKKTRAEEATAEVDEPNEREEKGYQ